MKGKKFWVAFTVILAAIGLIALLIFLPKKKYAHGLTVSPGKPQLQIETNELDGITIIMPGAERGSYWDLKLAKCTYNNDIGNLEDVSGEFFDSKKTLVYQISAQTGELFWKTRILQLRGKVLFKTSRDAPKELSADELIWDPGMEKRAGAITARDQVTFRTQDLLVYTTKVTTDLNFKKMIFSGDTKASFHK